MLVYSLKKTVSPNTLIPTNKNSKRDHDHVDNRSGALAESFGKDGKGGDIKKNGGSKRCDSGSAVQNNPSNDINRVQNGIKIDGMGKKEENHHQPTNLNGKTNQSKQSISVVAAENSKDNHTSKNEVFGTLTQHPLFGKPLQRGQIADLPKHPIWYTNENEKTDSNLQKRPPETASRASNKSTVKRIKRSPFPSVKHLRLLNLKLKFEKALDLPQIICRTTSSIEVANLYS